MKRTILKLIALLLTLSFVLLGVCSCDYYEIDDTDNGDLPEGERFVYVKFTLKGGDTFTVELDREAAPITVNNFVSLVERDFYNGLTFHRVIENFMVQGGCPKGNGSGNAGSYIKGEFAANGYDTPISHERGVISMARGGYSYDSASCQFFICVVDYPSLDGQYAAFGHVVEGMDTVDSIVYNTAHLATDGNGGGIPTDKRAVIETAEILEGYDK